MKKFLISLAIFLILIVPAFSFAVAPPNEPVAVGGLVPCETTASPAKCDFNQLLNLVNKVIQFILFSMAIPIAAIMFAYAGFLMVTAGGAESKTKAKNIFTNAVIGLVLAAGAWLIVRTILSILGYQGDWIGLPLINSLV